MIGDDHEYHQGPAQFRHQVCRGAPDAHQADQIGDKACHENGAYQRNVPVKLRAHISMHKVDEAAHDHFRRSLFSGDACNLQPGTQPDADCGDDQHDEPADDQGLGNVDRSKQRDIFEGGKNFSAVD